MSATTPPQSEGAIEPRAGRRRHALAEALRPRRLLESLGAAIVLYLLTVILTLSIAVLIYSGPLAAQLPHALGGVLIGAALLVATVSLFGSYGGSIASVQDATGAIVALGASAAAHALAAASVEVRFATVGVLVAGTTLAMGIVYLLVRVLRLGTLVRFMPHPVMGGFLAGTGWLLVIGGIGVSTDVPLGTALLEPAELARWLPALALGAAILWAVRRWRNPALVALLCALGIAVFYLLMWAFGRPPASLAADGWLLGPFPDALDWRTAFDPRALAMVEWRALAAAAPLAAPAVLIGAIALLLNISGLELSVRRDIALDRELLAHGVGNLASAVAGGFIGYTAISLSTLGHALAGGRRLPGVLVALLLVLTALFGTTLVSAIPRPAMAALLCYIGLALLYEWLVVARRTLPRSDYLVVLLIFTVIAIEDFLWGVALGLVVTALLFIVSYSRLGAVRFELRGDEVQSRVERGPRQRERLRAEGGRLLIFRLRGYLFFGTASGLLDRVRRRLGVDRGGRRYLLLDFEQVAGIDSTALTSFGRLGQYAAEHDIEIALSGLDEALARQFDREPALASLRRAADLDHGLEWCEERLLERGSDAPDTPDASPAGGLREQLLALVPDARRIDALLAHTAVREVRAGERVIRAGDAADALYLLESGQLTAWLARGDGGKAVRLQTVRDFGLVGELGFLLGTRRSADVVADRDSVLRVIAREEWQRIVARQPDVALTLDAIAIRLLGARVLHLTRVVDALQR
jgi:SulP family sulfate permease